MHVTDKQIIVSLTAANLKLHIESNELRVATIGFLDKMNTLKNENRFLELKIESMQRTINKLKGNQ